MKDYVILDDTDIFAEARAGEDSTLAVERSRFVKIDPAVGLSEGDVERALKILC